MWAHERRRGVLTATTLMFLAAVAAVGPARAGDWTLLIEPTLMDAYGHDQHVLNIHEIVIDPAHTADTTTGVNLETEDSVAFHSELRYSADTWAWGVDVTVFYTDQGTPDRTAAAGEAIDQVVFAVADRSFISSDPSEVLFYGVLEDTSLQTWTVDLYALRTLTEGPGSKLQLQLGLRTADFDNDYRAVVGIQDVGGRRLDASSNYDRMIGPLLGVIGRAQFGRSTVETAIALSVLLGSVELESMAREFTGPLSVAFPVEAEIPTTTSTETFKALEDVAIPVADLRIKWTYRITGWLALGVGASSSTWWDVPVPPGVVPGDDGLDTQHENTIVFFGMAGIVELTF